MIRLARAAGRSGRAITLLLVRAARRLPGLVTAGAAATVRGVLLCFALAGRGFQRGGSELTAAAKAIGLAVLALPAALWYALQRLASGAARLVFTLGLIALGFLRFVGRLQP